MLFFNLIAISGAARSGKDTLANMLKKFFSNRKTQQFSFALPIRQQLFTKLMLDYGISSFTTDSKEKAIIRPHFIEYATRKRKKDEDFFVKSLDEQISPILKTGVIGIISDLRFENELRWLRKKCGVLIYVERFDNEGNLILPASQDEKENNPILKKNADLIIQWETEDDFDKLYEKTRPKLEDFFKFSPVEPRKKKRKQSD